LRTIRIWSAIADPTSFLGISFWAQWFLFGLGFVIFGLLFALEHDFERFDGVDVYVALRESDDDVSFAEQAVDAVADVAFDDAAVHDAAHANPEVHLERQGVVAQVAEVKSTS